EAHMHPGDGGDCPWIAPAVAMEHRERPKVASCWRQFNLNGISQTIQVRAAMGIHDAFEMPGCSTRVIQRNQQVLVFDLKRQIAISSERDQVLISEICSTYVISPKTHDRS